MLLLFTIDNNSFFFLLGLGDPGGSAGSVEPRSGSCPCDWSQLEDKCYRYFTNKTTWADAAELCDIEGGALVAIHTDYENWFVEI